MSTNPTDASSTPEGAAGDAAVPADASPVALVALRDLAIVTTLLSVWAGAESWAVQSGLGMAAVLSSVGGLLAGAAVTAQIHEWGHFLGARLSGGVAPVARAAGIVPLFLFDFARSEERHFRAMSLGGNIAHWAAALGLLALLPGASSGQIALQCGALGFATFATTVELPVIRRAFAGEPGEQALTAIGPAELARSGWIGVATALGLFVIL